MRYAGLILCLFALPFAAAAADEFSTAAGPLRITPIQHASLMIEAGGKVIHVDPSSANTQAKYAALPKADLLLITDFHPDHMDSKAIAWVKQPTTKILAPMVVTSGIKAGETMHNGQIVHWGDFTIEAVPMYNIESKTAAGIPWHTKGRGNGYVITYGGKRIYISGDTEAIPEMKALKNIDIAFVCMNLPYTMSPQEAAEGVKAFAPKVVYPYHYRGSDLKLFAAGLQGTGIEVRLRNWYE
jgi:L-ascorbate metabolism protein UlaG (beta-lactamase superfamily)